MPFFKTAVTNEAERRLVIDLGTMDPLRFAQYQQWHEVFIAGPTRSVVGTLSNDFPGFYYYHPASQIEYVVMFEGPIDWRYCRIERRVIDGPDGQPHLVAGLFSDRKLHGSVKIRGPYQKKRVLLGGQQANDRDAMPGQWEALEVLAKRSFELLPLPEAGQPADWQGNAEECLNSLREKTSTRSLGENQLLLFFRTFVSNQSTYKSEPGEPFDGSAELICQAGLASSLLSYSATKPKNQKAFAALGRSLEQTLYHFYDPDAKFFHNTYPPNGEEWKRAVIDTWYSFHNLFHVLEAARLSQDDTLCKLAHQAIDRAVLFVQACQYQIPLFAKIGKGQELMGDGGIIGFALNPSVLGMYAMLLVNAADVFPKEAERYRTEAAGALARLHRWPVQQMFHQTVQLSWAAWAAHRLNLKDWRDDFTRCLLLSCYRQGEHAGLFQGCAGLGYPSFRETVEAITPWVEWLHEVPELPLRVILNLVLNKAARFLSKAPNAGLPQEGLATTEQTQAGQIGIAIYAAPQVFDLASIAASLARLPR